MRFKTVVESRVPSTKINTKLDKFLVVVLLIGNITLDTILPFIFGFYFARTENLIFLFLLCVSLIISVDFKYHNGLFEVKIKKGF